jgi:hypothetical protein
LLPTVAVLLALTGSAVVVVVVPVTVTGLPLAGAVKLMLHTKLSPTARLATGLAGLHTTLAPDGKPVTSQVALVAMLGPWFTHVAVPVTVLPAGGKAANPASVTAISACGVTAKGWASLLLATTGSAVVLPAVVVILSGPLAGAVKLAVHVRLLPTAKGLGTGLGKQVVDVPAGSPLNTHVGAVARLGPAFKHVPVTVAACPALTLAGTTVVACMSACGTVLMTGIGSALLELAVPVTVSGAPSAGVV